MLQGKDKITVVILTYGGRSFVFTVLDYLNCLSQIKDIVIVSNGYAFKAPKNIKAHVHVVNNKKNTGSAAGYSMGLDKAKELKNEFTWLLDDDNLPEEDALNQLLEVWNKNEFSLKSHSVALQCFRTSQFAYKNLFGSQELNLLPSENAFMCFHFKRLLRIFLNRVNPPLYSKQFKKKSFILAMPLFMEGYLLKLKHYVQYHLPIQNILCTLMTLNSPIILKEWEVKFLLLLIV